MTKEEFQAMFKRAGERARENSLRKKLYSRKEAYQLLGFKKSVYLTHWLQENCFISSDNYPVSYVIEELLMECVTKYRTRSLPIDDYGILIGGNEYSSTTKTETDYVPLFTEKGIAFFKPLIANSEELEKVKAEIRSQNQYYSIPIR